VLDQDLSLREIQVSPKDMALAEQQAFSESRLAHLLGVPAYLVGLPSGSDSLTYANVSAIFDHHWRAGLKPGGHTIFGALSGWALPAGQMLNLNAQSYIRPAPTDRASYYKQLFDMGAITVDEIRRNEGLEPLGIDPTDISSSTSLEGVTKDDPTVGAI
jgi:phage portal protein BeeE